MDVLGIESKIDFPRAIQTAHEETTANEQRERERHLGDEERAADAAAHSRTRAASPALERLAEIAAARGERRRKASHDPGGDGDHQDGPDDAEIDCEGGIDVHNG